MKLEFCEVLLVTPPLCKGLQPAGSSSYEIRICSFSKPVFYSLKLFNPGYVTTSVDLLLPARILRWCLSFDLAAFASGAVPSDSVRIDLMLFLWSSVLSGAAA